LRQGQGQTWIAGQPYRQHFEQDSTSDPPEPKPDNQRRNPVGIFPAIPFEISTEYLALEFQPPMFSVRRHHAKLF
jgi:hypothetical protein